MQCPICPCLICQQRAHLELLLLKLKISSRATMIAASGLTLMKEALELLSNIPPHM